MNEFIYRAVSSLNLVGSKRDIKSISPLYGGSINDSYKLITNSGQFFIKMNNGAIATELFHCESKGLKLLKASDAIKVPEILGVFEEENFALLVLEYIEDGVEVSNSWEDFGRSLAQLHMKHSDMFGLDHDNFIGSLEQKNTFKKSWSEFFVENRLEVQYSMARNKSLVDESFNLMLGRLYAKLDDLIPKEKAALLHGDLWSGNYKFNSFGEAFIFDPAVYYGHREVDLAMMHLFGGFDKRLFYAYDEVFPLQKDWEERIDLFNLYPLFVHVNLFGGSYVSRLRQVLKRYV